MRGYNLLIKEELSPGDHKLSYRRASIKSAGNWKTVRAFSKHHYATINIDEINGPDYHGYEATIINPGYLDCYWVMKKLRTVRTDARSLEAPFAVNSAQTFFTNVIVSTKKIYSGSSGFIASNPADGANEYSFMGFDPNYTIFGGKVYNESDLDGAWCGVTWRPWLVSGGVDAVPAGFSTTQDPRTAVGQIANGNIIVIVIDGRQAHTDGISVQDLRDLFLARNCVEAYNWDGGGSTTMVYDGNIVNSPCGTDTVEDGKNVRRRPVNFLVW